MNPLVIGLIRHILSTTATVFTGKSLMLLTGVITVLVLIGADIVPSAEEIRDLIYRYISPQKP